MGCKGVPQTTSTNLSQLRVTIQVIKIKNKHNLLLNNITLISYVLTATNKRYSYSRVATNGIEVHPVGEIWSIRHTHFTLGPCMALDHTYLIWSAYNNLSWVISSVGRILLLLRKSALDFTSQPGRVAYGTHLSFSPNTTIEAVGLSQASVDGRLLVLLSPYHQYAINTFNTCSRGPIYWSLIDTGRNYNFEGADLPHHTRIPSQPTVLRFPPKSSIRSYVNKPTLPTKLKRDQTLISRVKHLHSTSTVVYPLSIATTNGKPPRDRINKNK
jgi:hypothetical protein